MIVLVSMLAACGGDKPADKPAAAGSVNSAANPPALPANAPAVGAQIKDIASPEPDKPGHDGEYTKMAWEDLELPGKGMDDILKKYQAQIDAIPEGDPREKAVMEKMQADLNSAPVNPALNGKKIKLPGYVTPLEVDEKAEVVREFLLVPYFGACIHVPPPPLNQTILVKTEPGKALSMGDMYSPIWVYGTLDTDLAHTDLADAGYQIKTDKIEIYQEKDQEGGDQ